MSLLCVALRSPAFCCVNPLGEGALGFCFRAALAFAGAAEGDVPRYYRTAGLWRAPRPRAARDPPSSSLRPSPTRTHPPLQFRPSLLALPLLSDACCFCCCVRCCCVCCCVCCCCCRVVVVVGASVARSTANARQNHLSDGLPSASQPLRTLRIRFHLRITSLCTDSVRC